VDFVATYRYASPQAILQNELKTGPAPSTFASIYPGQLPASLDAELVKSVSDDLARADNSSSEDVDKLIRPAFDLMGELAGKRSKGPGEPIHYRKTVSGKP